MKSQTQARMILTTVLILTAPLAAPSFAAGQDIKDESGNMFMEETTPTPRAPKPAKIQMDLSNLGVPVDAKGHIVPIIDRTAPGGVRQNYSNLEVYSEPAWNFLPAPVYNAYGQPMNFYPQANYPVSPYGMPYRSPYGAPFGMPFGTPYNPYNNNVGINLGKNFHLNFGSPSPYGYGGGLGMPNLNPITNPTPMFGAPPFYGGGYPTLGGPPLYGGSMFAPPVGGFGLNLFAPSYTQWQSTSTYTPLVPNLNGP
jgi:hypothetical protein